MLAAAVLLALLAVDLWRRGRTFKARMDAIDKFMEWGAYEKIDGER